MKKCLFIDRDGTLIAEPEDEQVDSLEKFRFLPGMISSLRRIATESDFELVMVSNQDGLGTPAYPESDFQPLQDLLLRTLEGEGIQFAAIHIDRSTADAPSGSRKPGTGMLTCYLNAPYDIRNCWVIGDRESDIQLAKNLGCKSIYIGTESELDADFRVSGWPEIEDMLMNRPRCAEIERRTAETDISLRLDLDGTGVSNINTGIGFFDHLLEQISRHGKMDLDINCHGDLYVDEHHSVEDTALTLGTAFRDALGSKKGLARYGFVLPMDECLATVALDFSGRPVLVWKAEFKREKIGDLPTELFSHFFKSFCDTAGCTLHIQAEGENEHHKIEGIFKAFAKSLAMAVQRSGSQLPSTKGLL